MTFWNTKGRIPSPSLRLVLWQKRGSLPNWRKPAVPAAAPTATAPPITTKLRWADFLPRLVNKRLGIVCCAR